MRLPPPGYGTLAEALTEVDREGYNAVNFFEFTFIPTREQPDHDHPDFQRTLRTYYPFAPALPYHMKAWKAGAAGEEVDLLSSGGHFAEFSGRRLYPESFILKHYLFLSVPHAIEKYVKRRFNPEELKAGWHGWRARLGEIDLLLPSESELRRAESDEELDPSEPRRRHYLDDLLAAAG